MFHNRVHNLNTLDTFHRDEELIWSGTSTWAHLIQTRKGNEKQQELMLASNLIKPLNEEKQSTNYSKDFCNWNWRNFWV